ncbi:molybdopterin molybdotransferase MoeA [Sulfurimonas sp.]|uniref:molybdopterin molybdotransferase MoeA n=1 Tax=Sulfurimonas sp. TaxID=2022749 RepID=UPI002AB1187D|nr:molybdopterin molybdotransferase MoeA [Sulfurimonas sp.]
MEVTIKKALEIIYKNSKKKSLKILPIESVLGCILAQDIIATHNLPPYDNSAMDGYTVKSIDAGKCVKVEHTIFAGDNSSEVLKNDYAIKIMTGAKIPEGCELIVPIEDTKECQGGVQLPQTLTPSKHIRLCGEDIKSGEILLKSGDKLQAHQITLLASQGISHVKVYKKPRIALFASGSELKMHFESVEAYQLYNTNTPALFSRSLELGCEVDFIGTAKDTLEDLKEHIKSALNSDLIITSGGVSVGDADYTKEAFSAFGMQTYFDKVQIKPGKPTTFGTINDTLVLNLPGNPLAASLNFELFAQSIILALSGNIAKYINTIQTKMKTNYKLKKGRITLVPGFFDGVSFEACNKFAPGMVSPLASSNSYIMIDEGVDFIASEDSVKIIPIRWCFTSKEMVDLLTKPL